MPDFPDDPADRPPALIGGGGHASPTASPAAAPAPVPGCSAGVRCRLFESAPAMLHAVDPGGLLLAVSDRWLATLGHVREDVIGRHFADFLPEALRVAERETELPALFNGGKAVAGGHAHDRELQMLTKSGATLDVRLSASPEFDARGGPVRAVVALEDVTARLRADRTLREEHYRLASIIESTGAGTWEIDLQQDRFHYNEAWAGMLGYTLAELSPLTSSTWINLMHPDDIERARAAVNAHLVEHKPYECEMRMRHRDGHWVWILTRGRVLSWTDDGKHEWMFGSHMDITLRKHHEEALRKSTERLALATDSGGIGIWELEVAGRVLTIDAWGCRLCGLAPEATVTSQPAWLALVHPEDRAAVGRAVEQALGAGAALDTEFRVVWPDGSVRHLRATARMTFGADGSPLRLVGAQWDVTALRQLSAQLAQQHELLRVTLESIGDGVLTTDARGRVTWLNPVAERMTGWPTAQAEGRPVTEVFRIVDQQSRAPNEDPVTACLLLGQVVELAEHTVLISRGGAEFGIADSAAPIRDAAGAVLGAVLVFHDVTEQRRLADEMSHRAKHDALTGLVNRSEFETRLDRALRSAHEQGSEHALLFIDLDQFKLVNDACGHAAGDQLLQQVSRLLGDSVRARDTLARLGGDEFAVILEHCAAEQAQRVAQKICDLMEDFRFVHEARRFRIGTSIGLVPLDRRWSTAGAAMQAADTSCYAAKEAGRNRVHVWFDTDLAMRARTGETNWVPRIEQALDEGRFTLLAQRIEPVSAAARRRATGVHAEVLLRMVDGEGGLIAPGAFLPAAERFHLSARIDRWVLAQASAWLVAQQERVTIETLSINLSGQSVGDRAFHRDALDILDATGPGLCRRICFEITETAAITHFADAAAFIAQVRRLGVRVALDDFGAGASSFGYLKSLAVDLLKIDGQFITGLLDNPLDDAAVRCFVDVARVMGLQTVAEFVERRDVLARLGDIGVDYAQGFVLHRPAPIDELIEAALQG